MTDTSVLFRFPCHEPVTALGIIREACAASPHIRRAVEKLITNQKIARPSEHAAADSLGRCVGHLLTMLESVEPECDRLTDVWWHRLGAPHHVKQPPGPSQVAERLRRLIALLDACAGLAREILISALPEVAERDAAVDALLQGRGRPEPDPVGGGGVIRAVAVEE